MRGGMGSCMRMGTEMDRNTVSRMLVHARIRGREALCPGDLAPRPFHSVLSLFNRKGIFVYGWFVCMREHCEARVIDMHCVHTPTLGMTYNEVNWRFWGGSV